MSGDAQALRFFTSGLQILFGTMYNRPNYGGISLDVTLEEIHAYNSQTSQYPVQSGSTVIDNVIKTPTVVRMRCIVSDSSISTYQTFVEDVGRDLNRLTAGNIGLRSITTLEALIRLQEERIPTVLVTGIRVYQNMILTNMKLPRSRDTGRALIFELEFTEVMLATVSVSKDLFQPETIRTPIAQKQFPPIVSQGVRTLIAINPFKFQAAGWAFSLIRSVVGF